MPSPEHGERNQGKEKEPIPYYQAARFRGEQPAGRVYFETQQTIFNNPDCDLSVYRLQLNRLWHVVLLGDPPRRELEQRLLKVLSSGKPATLPADILRVLQERRTQAIKRGTVGRRPLPTWETIMTSDGATRNPFTMAGCQSLPNRLLNNEQAPKHSPKLESAIVNSS